MYTLGSANCKHEMFHDLSSLVVEANEMLNGSIIFIIGRGIRGRWPSVTIVFLRECKAKKGVCMSQRMCVQFSMMISIFLLQWLVNIW